MGIQETLRQAIRDKQQKGESLRELAKRSDVSHSAICRFLNGTKGLNFHSAGLLCAYLGLELAKKANP